MRVDTLPARIRRVLERNGWTEREGAKRAGFNATSQLSTVLATLDKNPDAVELRTLRTLRKIATGLGVSFDWLVTGRDELADQSLRAPRFRDLPVWPALLADSKASAPSIPAWVWDTVAASQPLAPPESLRVSDVVGLAEYVLRHCPRPTP